MSENSELVDKLKEELRTFGSLNEIGLALLTIKGKILYSDLPNNVQQKIMLFKRSFPGLTVGSNITLAAENESVIVIRPSKKMLMAVQTQQRVGFTLVMLSTLIKKYTSEFDKYVKTVTKSPKAKPKLKAIAAEAAEAAAVTEKLANVSEIVKLPSVAVKEAPAEVAERVETTEAVDKIE